MYGANPRLSEELGLERQWLHAMQLEFRHPRTHVTTVVTSHYPADLQHALDMMRAHHADHPRPIVQMVNPTVAPVASIPIGKRPNITRDHRGLVCPANSD